MVVSPWVPSKTSLPNLRPFPHPTECTERLSGGALMNICVEWETEIWSNYSKTQKKRPSDHIFFFFSANSFWLNFEALFEARSGPISARKCVTAQVVRSKNHFCITGRMFSRNRYFTVCEQQGRNYWHENRYYSSFSFNFLMPQWLCDNGRWQSLLETPPTALLYFFSFLLVVLCYTLFPTKTMCLRHTAFLSGFKTLLF